jgi:hypothetical protein
MAEIYQQIHRNAMLFPEQCLVELCTANISFDEMVYGVVELVGCIVLLIINIRKRNIFLFDFIYLLFCSAELDKALDILDCKKAEYFEKWYSIICWWFICV